MEIGIERINEWEQEMKKKQQENRVKEEEEEINLRGSKRSIRSINSASRTKKSIVNTPQVAQLPESRNLPPTPPRKNTEESEVKPPSSKASL